MQRNLPILKLFRAHAAEAASSLGISFNAEQIFSRKVCPGTLLHRRQMASIFLSLVSCSHHLQLAYFVPRGAHLLSTTI